MVACYKALFSNVVFTQRTSEFTSMGSTVTNVCNINFDINKGQVQDSHLEVIISKLYTNECSEPEGIQDTFQVS